MMGGKMNCKEEVDRICKFIKDTVKDAGAKGVVLGLSGGLDSAVVYKLCERALGRNTLCIYMPERVIPMDIIEYNIRLLTTNIVVEPIQDIVDLITDNGEVNKLTEGNVKARIRMVNLYCHANLC